MEWTGMCGMWFLQLCLSGETSAETGNRINEKDGIGEPRKKK